MITITGFPGSGKSEISKVLLQAGFEIFDLDSLIEKEEKKSIPEIIQTFGEGYFRELESKILARVISQELPASSNKAPQKVIFLGGGTLLSETNRKIIEKTFIINLGVSLKKATARILEDEATQAQKDQAQKDQAQQTTPTKIILPKRPIFANLVTSKKCPNLTEAIKFVYQQREPIYQNYHLKIWTDNLTPSEIVEIILREVVL